MARCIILSQFSRSKHNHLQSCLYPNPLKMKFPNNVDTCGCMVFYSLLDFPFHPLLLFMMCYTRQADGDGVVDGFNNSTNTSNFSQNGRPDFQNFFGKNPSLFHVCNHKSILFFSHCYSTKLLIAILFQTMWTFEVFSRYPFRVQPLIWTLNSH